MRNLRRLPPLSVFDRAFLDDRSRRSTPNVDQPAAVRDENQTGKAPAVEAQPLKLRTRTTRQDWRAFAKARNAENKPHRTP